MSNTLVHEAELILEASAHYIAPMGENGVPEEHGIGWTGNKYDFAQGYGMAMVDRAVAIALTLKELRTRDFDDDGMHDYPDATVLDAMKYHESIMMKGNITEATDSLESSWRGEWVKLNNQTTNVMPYYTDESHFLYIPPEGKTLKLTLSFSMVQTEKPQVGTLNLVIDADGDGNYDWSQPIDARENKVSEVNLESSTLASSRGNVWVFNVQGYGLIMPLMNFFKENQFYEARIPYTVSTVLVLQLSGTNDTFIDYENLLAAYGQWEFSSPSNEYANGSITMSKYYFELGNIQPLEAPPEEEKAEPPALWPWLLLALVLIAIIILYSRYRKKKKQSIPYAETVESNN
jgi:hypothetical protein